MSERDFYVDSDACTEGEKKPIAFADLFGYIPNITGGLSVAEYVAGRSSRRGSPRRWRQ